MKILDYHAHLYYDDETYEKALRVINKARDLNYIQVGRAHQKEVGPHPRWSCQFLFSKEKLNDFIPWLFENRDELTVFLHANTGNDYLDHTQNTLWMGEVLSLKLDIFNK
ncbi:4,5-dioxygenase [Halobacteriovorax vibrionivorans]|uniref:4,5-dioxygenase n=1 Tax=Halobacteriovorax vibrionivorans TaxID=2152716 RepID=A0ABY0IGJ6_9BACT|nr:MULTISPECIES: DOPA 4,5-dioxygenase family protein [Halobacteriovorax]RZF22058.1 4,5-dioxygenase [Halobacteriovorax vibrionivorans]TGD47078.1 4,5-dioxygenase [Halobacteriovorax sp. Y22]